MKGIYKKVKVLTMLALLAFANCMIAQSTVTVKFTGETETGGYAQLHHVVIQDLTKDWEKTVFYPDAVLILTNLDGIADQIFDSKSLAQNYPNPFSGNTMLEVSLPKSSIVLLQVFDLNGKLCASYSGHLRSGEFQFEISLSVPQTYVAKVTTDFGSACVKMLNLEKR
jgi:hypothetical protein